MDPPTFKTSSDSEVDCLDEFHIAMDHSSRAINMDTLIPELLAFPPHPPPAIPLTDAEYDKQIRSVVKLLNQLPAKKLTGNVAGGSNLLDVLDPSINTLPYLYALHAQIQDAATKQTATAKFGVFSPASPLWAKVVSFVERFDAVQIRYGGSEFRRLIEIIAKSVQAASTVFLLDMHRLPDISPADSVQRRTVTTLIRTAILRFDPSSSCFTSNHLLLVRLCLECREYRAALPVLDKDIFHLPSSPNTESSQVNPPFLCSSHEFSSSFITSTSHISEKLDHTHLLRYFLFGAMIYTKLRNWTRALHFLEVVITSPTVNTASMIQVEAFKKWILVNLLANGQVPSIPRTINVQGAKHIVNLSRAYESLGQIFHEGISNESNASRLTAEVKAGKEIWRDDFNTGLIWQVVDAYRRFSILKLQKTYAALYIRDVAHRTSPDPADYLETLRYVSSLILSGQLNAILVESAEDPATAVLRFSTASQPGPQTRTEEQLLEDLRAQTGRIVNLNDHVWEIDRRLGLSKEYIHSAKKMHKNKDAGVYADFNTMLPINDDSVVDEDMMADL